MSRPKKNRRIQMAPHLGGFKPFDLQTSEGVEIGINYEEYEALKLCDYELLTQAQAAELMKISRPTFTRLYESVRRKIARAFVEGCGIRLIEGKHSIALWHFCNNCKITYSKVSENPNCPFCKRLENHKIKLAIATAESNLSGKSDPHFGRCQWFYITDGNTAPFFVKNPASGQEEQAGYSAVNILLEHNIGIVVAGRFGSKSMIRLKEVNIQMVVPNPDSTLQDIIHNFFY